MQAAGPDDRLPDPGLTLDEQRSRPVQDGVDERARRLELGLAPDNLAGCLRGHASQAYDSAPRLTDRREKVVARVLAAAADVGAKAAVLMVGGVPVTLLGTGEAGDATGLDHCADKTQVSGCLAGHNAAGRVADLGAVEAEANATHHLLHVVLSEIGVGTTRTARGTIEALVDAAQHRAAIEAGRLWMRVNDLVKSHFSPFVRAQR